MCVHVVRDLGGSETPEMVQSTNTVCICAPAGVDTAGQCLHPPRRFCTDDSHKSSMCPPLQISAAGVETAPVQKCIFKVLELRYTHITALIMTKIL